MVDSSSGQGSTRVLIIGNYRPDDQKSMARYADTLRDALTSQGIQVALWHPPVVLGRPWKRPPKWVAYLDKFVLAFVVLFLRRLVGGPVWYHIADHSNAMYAFVLPRRRTVATCHDLLAVRGALGEDTDCPASRSGALLQKWIVAGLGRAGSIVSVSEYTAQDVVRLVHSPGQRRTVIPHFIDRGMQWTGSAPPFGLAPHRFLLHVGSDLKRKNREVIVRWFAQVHRALPLDLVFVGPQLTEAHGAILRQAGVEPSRVRCIRPVSDAELAGLYTFCHAFVFPSRFEGFGWPLIEAQQCGGPVVASGTPVHREVGGDGALYFPAEDADELGRQVASLSDGAQRQALVARGTANLERFSFPRISARWGEFYGRATP